jgi:hypothetical protein
MFSKTMRRVLTGAVAAAGLTAVLAAPAGAAEQTTAQTNAPSAVPCPNNPGNYCVRATVLRNQHVGGRLGVIVTATRSTGYTTGNGRGHESVVYTCNAGLCATSSTRNISWGFDNKLVASHHLRLFVPCGGQFGTAWLGSANPRVLAPGHPGNGVLQFRVVCNGPVSHEVQFAAN